MIVISMRLAITLYFNFHTLFTTNTILKLRQNYMHIHIYICIYIYTIPTNKHANILTIYFNILPLQFYFCYSCCSVLFRLLLFFSCCSCCCCFSFDYPIFLSCFCMCLCVRVNFLCSFLNVLVKILLFFIQKMIPDSIIIISHV